MSKSVGSILIALVLLAGALSTLLSNKQQSLSPPSTNSADQHQTSKEVSIPASTANAEESDHFLATPKPPAQASPSLAGSSKRIKGEIRALTFSSTENSGFQTRFPPSTKSIYLTITPTNIAKRVKLTVSYRSVMNKGEQFSQPVPEAGSPQRRVFNLDSPPKGWTPGPYQVVVRPQGSEQVIGLSRFEIEKPDSKPAPAYASPEYIELTDDLTADAASTVFDVQCPQIYLRIDSSKLPEGVQISSVWSAIEVNQLETGELVATSSLPAPNPDEDTIFYFSPPKGGFHPGSYRVEVYFDQQLVSNQAFFIESTSVKSTKGLPTP